MRTPAKIGLGALTFAVVCVGFVLTMRSCARAIWPTQISTVAFDSLRARACAYRNEVRR